jgi:hypothetical protein
MTPGESRGRIWYIVPPMQIQTQTVFVQIARARWCATMQTHTGPIAAFGDCKGAAQHRLDELLVMRRALEFTLESDPRR